MSSELASPFSPTGARLVSVVLATLFAMAFSSVARAEAHDVREVLDLEEAAVFLRILPEKLETLAAEGEVPARKIGDDWRFHRSALRQWLGVPPLDEKDPGSVIEAESNADDIPEKIGRAIARCRSHRAVYAM